jgi:hypothetical protein
VQRSANRLVRFSGDTASIKLTVEVCGMRREDAVRAAVGEVARMFPNSNDEKYGEPHVTPPVGVEFKVDGDSKTS